MWIPLAVVGVLVLWAVADYNGLVQLRVRADGAWSDISVQLKRRYDLIPNIVEAVKGYAAHEKNLFVQVTAARSQAMMATGPKEKEAAEGMLTNTLKSLFAVAENYPQLRANENFMNLQNSLSQVEDALQDARRYYNAVVRDYNTKCQQLPDSLIARLGHLDEDLLLVGGVALHRLDEVRDEVVAALQLDADVGPRPVRPRAQLDEPVVDEHPPHDDRRRHDEDPHVVCLLPACVYSTATFVNCQRSARVSNRSS